MQEYIRSLVTSLTRRNHACVVSRRFIGVIVSKTICLVEQVLVSGGVDSTVCAALLRNALREDQVIALHIDNGKLILGCLYFIIAVYPRSISKHKLLQ